MYYEHILFLVTILSHQSHLKHLSREGWRHPKGLQTNYDYLSLLFLRFPHSRSYTKYTFLSLKTLLWRTPKSICFFLPISCIACNKLLALKYQKHSQETIKMRSAKSSIEQGSLSCSLRIYVVYLSQVGMWVCVLGCCACVLPSALCSFPRTFPHFHRFPTKALRHCTSCACCCCPKRGCGGRWVVENQHTRTQKKKRKDVPHISGELGKNASRGCQWRGAKQSSGVAPEQWAVENYPHLQRNYHPQKCSMCDELQ